MEASENSRPVRVRFAPSPTGPIHVGGIRTTLFNVLFARQHGDTFILRVEDTDKERSEKKYEDELLGGISWVGLTWDEGPSLNGPDRGNYGPYRQSERTELYTKYLQELLDKKLAYYCYCTKEDLERDRQEQVSQKLVPKYSGRCRDLTSAPEGKKAEVIRFKVPEIKVEFTDLVRGNVTFDTALFGDIVIAKDITSPLYNFAVVVDDELMAITHVIRGEEHLSNTPRQIVMQEALGFKKLTYAHIPLILNADRTKMSKRFADVSLESYRERGYVPEAMINFLALLGWHPTGDKEMFTLEELTKEFSMERVQQAGAIFNEEKLDWLNREHMKAMPIEELLELAKPFFMKANIDITDQALLQRAVTSQLPRAKTLVEIVDASTLFFVMPEYEMKLLAWKETSLIDAGQALEASKIEIEKISLTDFNREGILHALEPITSVKGRGAVLWPLRVALSGQATSPDPMEIMEVLGPTESLKRIEAAIQKIASTQT